MGRIFKERTSVDEALRLFLENISPLRYIEEVKEFPPAIKSYIDNVTTYNNIFLTIEKYGLYS